MSTWFSGVDLINPCCYRRDWRCYFHSQQGQHCEGFRIFFKENWGENRNYIKKLQIAYLYCYNFRSRSREGRAAASRLPEKPERLASSETSPFTCFFSFQLTRATLFIFSVSIFCFYVILIFNISSSCDSPHIFYSSL